MNENTKVTLSDGELAIALNKDFILTKRTVIEKAGLLFNNQIESISKVIATGINNFAELKSVSPKISKGENYNGLPYVMLDYPSVFEKENIFALRTFFLWGNFVSISLHLSGTYKMHFQDSILNNMQGDDWYICINENEWQHHFEADNYKLYTALTSIEIEKIRINKFIKIALKYKLHHWNMMQQLLPQGYKKISDLLFF
jgi:hypothetical protein